MGRMSRKGHSRTYAASATQSAANLAASLSLSGASVGLLDADIYGPSVPALMGAHAQPGALALDQDFAPAYELVPLGVEHPEVPEQDLGHRRLPRVE